ncbi:hypothetical protein JB92DRAFT_3047358 [Gautieria morchelliformis]|nr:hypothetical protein JB92DRAFT_3047358 [Gautieria morchelliformis]
MYLIMMWGFKCRCPACHDAWRCQCCVGPPPRLPPIVSTRQTLPPTKIATSKRG